MARGCLVAFPPRVPPLPPPAPPPPIPAPLRQASPNEGPCTSKIVILCQPIDNRRSTIDNRRAPSSLQTKVSPWSSTLPCFEVFGRSKEIYLGGIAMQVAKNAHCPCGEVLQGDIIYTRPRSRPIIVGMVHSINNARSTTLRTNREVSGSPASVFAQQSYMG